MRHMLSLREVSTVSTGSFRTALYSRKLRCKFITIRILFLQERHFALLASCYSYKSVTQYYRHLRERHFFTIDSMLFLGGYLAILSTSCYACEKDTLYYRPHVILTRTSHCIIGPMLFLWESHIVLSASCNSYKKRNTVLQAPRYYYAPVKRGRNFSFRASTQWLKRGLHKVIT
jgi:hypothetical protein